jgi:hypothetical protein
MWCREQVIMPQSWELQYLVSVSDIIWMQVLQELILLRSFSGLFGEVPFHSSIFLLNNPSTKL